MGMAAIGGLFLFSFVAAGLALPATGQGATTAQTTIPGAAYVGGHDAEAATVNAAALTGTHLPIYAANRHLQTFGPQGTCSWLTIEQNENESANAPLDPDDVVGAAASSGIGVPVYAANSYLQAFGQQVVQSCPIGYP
ncbi:MAG: hypothetical protein JRM86_06135 [Nitrososphaerota archaeon]|nr:hypothetical protein [Nitrososphaerota archaeon]